MKLYLRILAVLYGLGALVHLALWLDIPLPGDVLTYSEMPPTVRPAVKLFLFLDTGTAIGLWLGRRWGITFFLMAAFGQIILYTGFSALYGQNMGLVSFHAIALLVYLILWVRTRSPIPLG